MTSRKKPRTNTPKDPGKRRAGKASAQARKAKREAGDPIARQCTARRTNGEPCKNSAIRGGVVCARHGGSAPQVRAKANERLREMVLPALGELRKIIDAPTTTDADKLKAINMVLNRTGYNERHSIDVGLREPTPWDNLEQAAFQITRGKDAVVWGDGHELGQGDDPEQYNLESRRNANRELEERDTYLADLDTSDIVVGRVVKQDPAYPPGPIDHKARDRRRSNRPSELDPFPQGESPHRDGIRAYEREEGP